MSTRKPVIKRPRGGIGIPPGLGPFEFASNEGHTAAPSKGVELYTVYDKGTRLDDDLPIEGDAHRKVLLQRVIGQFKSGYDMENRDMRLILTRDEWQAFVAEMKVLNAPVPRRVRSAFRRYTELLRRADRLNNLAVGKPAVQRFHGFGSKKPLSVQAEAAYERALEVLDEILEEEPGLVTWLDRPYKLGNIADQWADEGGVPRLITSQSEYALRNDELKQSKRDLKLTTLQDSLANLDESPQKSRLVLPPLDDVDLGDTGPSTLDPNNIDTDLD